MTAAQRHDPRAALLGDLLDREAIREVLARYCRAADRCDEDLLRTCYHRDALGPLHRPLRAARRDLGHASREVVHDWSERRACGPPMPHADTYPAGRRDRDDLSYRR